MWTDSNRELCSWRQLGGMNAGRWGSKTKKNKKIGLECESSEQSVREKITRKILPIRIHSHGSNTTWNSNEFRGICLFPFVYSISGNSGFPMFSILGNTGYKGPNTHWVHCENIVSIGNMWLQCAQWLNAEYILNIPRYVTQICPVGTFWVHFECAQLCDSNVPNG